MAVPRRTSAFEKPQPFISAGEAVATRMRGNLEEDGVRRQSAQTGALAFRAWSELVPEQRGPLDFVRFPHQVELYGQRAAEDREQVFQKATQIGESTRVLRLSLFHADVHQRVVLYTFPTDGELTDFSRQRIRPVIRASEHLMRRMRGDAVNNVGQKEIGPDGWLYFRGTNKPIDSIPADVVIFDEYDTSDQANIEASERRVSGPMSAGLIRRVGVPSIPGFGISSLYEDSDQRVWTVQCEACADWNPMRGFEAFSSNVDQERVELVCRACRKPIDVRAGEWVATYPDREVRGYHIPRLLIPGRRTIHDLIVNSKKTKDYQRTAFFTRDLGEPYAPVEGRLSLGQVRANERPELRMVDPFAKNHSHNLRTMGVDVASVRALNVVVEEAVDAEHGRKIWVGEIEDDPARGTAFVQLCRIIDALGINMTGIDDGPEGRFAIALAAAYPGRVYRCSFFTPGKQQKKPPEPWMVDDQAQFVSLWRTRAYDATFERFRMQRALIPPLASLPADYAEHLGNLYRRKTEQPDGSIRVDYVKTGPEDYGQAEAYNLAAIELYWRNAGLRLAAGQGPVPAAQLDPYATPDYDEFDEPGEEPTYRGGFD